MDLLSIIINFLVYKAVPFVILLGILVFVHELGHFLVARYNGVRVEVFSLGFGKKNFPIQTWRHRLRLIANTIGRIR